MDNSAIQDVQSKAVTSKLPRNDENVEDGIQLSRSTQYTKPLIISEGLHCKFIPIRPRFAIVKRALYPSSSRRRTL